MSAIKISRSHFNACANSPDLKTCGQNKTANQNGPTAELRWLHVVSGRQVQSSSGPWQQLGSTDSHCDPPPLSPPSSRSGVDTVAAVFQVDGAQTGTDAGNAAQLERRAGRPGVVGGEKGSGGERRRSVACLRGRDGLF